MADAPWRCSQCGTVNEPVANACRTCGRWPSLFDLEQSTIEADLPAAVDDDPYAAQSVDVEEMEPEAFDVNEAAPSDEVDMPPEFEEKPRGVRGTEAALAAARARHHPDRLRDLSSRQVRRRRQLALEQHLARLDRSRRAMSVPVRDLEPSVAQDLHATSLPRRRR